MGALWFRVDRFLYSDFLPRVIGAKISRYEITQSYHIRIGKILCHIFRDEANYTNYEEQFREATVILIISFILLINFLLKKFLIIANCLQREYQ